MLKLSRANVILVSATFVALIVLVVALSIVNLRVGNAGFNCEGVFYSGNFQSYYEYPRLHEKAGLYFDWYENGSTLLLVDEFGRLHLLELDGESVRIDVEEYWSVGGSYNWAAESPTVVAPTKSGVALFTLPLTDLYFDIPIVEGVTDPSISVDGMKLAALAQAEKGDWELSVLQVFDLTAASPEMLFLSNLRRHSQLSGWSSDGRWVALTQARLSGLTPQYFSVHDQEMTASRQNQKRQACALWLAWSPKDSSIVFAGVDREVVGFDLFVETLPSGSNREHTLRNLTHTQNADEFDATWSPNGEQIAYVSMEEVDGVFRQDIQIMQVANGLAPLQLTRSADEYEFSPVWSVDEDHLLYLSWSVVDEEWTLKRTSIADGSDTVLLVLPQDWYEKPNR